jgi:hypothetical protein
MNPFRRAFILGVAVLFLATFTGLAAAEEHTVVRSPSGTTTTVILIRHADRNMFSPDLNEAGRARAAALPAALANFDLKAIYTLNLKRNLDTAKPLARQRGIKIKVIKDSQVATRLVNENPGKVVLWVGNSANLEEIYRDLGGEGRAPKSYGDLYILKVRDKGDTEVVKRHFGR